MKKRATFMILLTFTTFLLINCKTNINSMIDDYNQNFKQDTTEEDKVKTYPCPGDEDFSEDKMLEEEYYVWEDASLNLSAPDKCVSYKWTITDPDIDEDLDNSVEFHPFGYEEYYFVSEWKEKKLFLNMLDSGLSINKVYILTLEVVSEEGRSYNDKTALVIYRHLVF